MSSPVNAFFKILLNGQQEGRTPDLLASGVLHCVEISAETAGSAPKYLQVAYYTDGATANENSLTNSRAKSAEFRYQNGILVQDVSVPRIFVETNGFDITVANNGVITFAPKPAVVPAVNYTYDLTITLLDLTSTLTVPVPSYNELDSDVVLTTASPTAWNRPQPTGSDIVIKSNVLTLIYAALYKKQSANTRESYIILGNTDDFSSAHDTPFSSTRVWQFDEITGSTSSPYNPTTGEFSFDKSVTSPETILSCKRVDDMLKGIAPNLLQANDTIDITVNGIDSDTRNLYTSTLTFTGGNSADQYPANLFAGLLEKNPAAYASKQAICIAVSKYNLGTGLNTTQNPPFQFSYQKSGLFKVLNEVILDFDKYYYIVYHFAQASSFVRALRLFSKPTKNAEALKDYVVIADKNDAYVDLELPEKPTDENKFTHLAITTTKANGDKVTIRSDTSPSTTTYQFFTLESDLYGGGRTEATILGTRLRVHLGKLDATTIKIEITATGGSTGFKGSISKRNILNRAAALLETATTKDYIELSNPEGWSSFSTTVKSAFNDDISQWDIKYMCESNTNFSFSSLLSGFESFNQPLGNWNTSNIVNMASMFKDAKSFNQPINTWNTAKVTGMASMFEGATSFNQSLAGWNLAGLNTVESMFKGASAFNGSVFSATSVLASSMFEGATSFNQPFDKFSVTSCKAMFNNASAFNQLWEVGGAEVDDKLIILTGTNNCTSMESMFRNAISLGQVSTGGYTSNFTHSLPSAVINTVSMFEGASSWNYALTSSGNAALTDTSSMYKGASAFNKEVSIADVTSTLNCTSMFENAISLNSTVKITGGSSSQIRLDSMFRNAVVFNKNVIFVHKISSATKMFQGATAYGNDDIVSGTATPKPKLGGVSDAYNISAASTAKLEYMFDGTRFDDTVTGTAPADCSYMFAGASYFNTQLGSTFMTSATTVTNLTGMFKDATSLEVSPFPATAFLSNVTNLTSTFEGATQFNADIRAWGDPLPTLVDYTRTFQSATKFNQDIPSSWPKNSKTDTFTNASAYTFATTW